MFSIQTNNLTKIYRKQHLLKASVSLGIEDVNLSVQKGEIFGLLGLNGSGKTTTIKLILGLLKPTRGSVSVTGISPSLPEALRKIGYLPEVPYFYKYLTASEILSLYARLSDLDDASNRVKKIIEAVGLSDWSNRRLSEFSKGMLQRIGIAQSLLHDPEILVYDEPVSGLDPLAMQEMRNLLLKLKSDGKTIFLSSHLISEVEKICDRAAILVKGRLVHVLDQHAWANKTGELERIFIASVSDSSEMGRIKV